MLRVRAALVALAVAASVLGGCGGEEPGGGGAAPELTSPPTTPPDTPEPSPEPPGGPVPETLRFQAPTVDGGTLDATTLAGRPVVFWFWASWCPRCAAFAGDLRDVQAEYEEQVQVVGVAGLGSGAEGMRAFVDQHDLDAFPHLADDEGEVWVRFEVTVQEYVVVLDAAGEIVREGPISAAELRDQLAALTA